MRATKMEIWELQHSKQNNSLGARCSNSGKTRQCLQWSPVTPTLLDRLISLALMCLLLEFSFQWAIWSIIITWAAIFGFLLIHYALPVRISYKSKATITTAMPTTTKPPPQPSSSPKPQSHISDSTPSQLLHFRWNISKASLIVFYPQPALSPAFSLLANGISATQATMLEIWEPSLNFQFPLPPTSNLRPNPVNYTSITLKSVFSSLFPWLLQFIIIFCLDCFKFSNSRVCFPKGSSSTFLPCL